MIILSLWWCCKYDGVVDLIMIMVVVVELCFVPAGEEERFDRPISRISLISTNLRPNASVLRSVNSACDLINH